MPKEIDEDLIEATIRRVAEAAASKGADASSLDDDADKDDPVADAIAAAETENASSEDALQSTMRRIASEKAARAARPAEDIPPMVDEDPIEATIRRVAAEKAARAGTPEDDVVPVSEEEEEDPIEAAIRRVAAEKAARAVAPEDDVAASAAEEDPIEATIRRVAAERAARTNDLDEDDAVEHVPAAVVEPAEAQAGASGGDEGDAYDEAPMEPTRVVRPQAWQPQPEPERTPTAAHVAAYDDDALARIERRVNETAEALSMLFERVDRLIKVVERAGMSGPVLQPVQPQPVDVDYDAPVVPRVPMSPPPRPSILRDPSPQTATAEHLEADVIDTRPLPKPLPPIQVGVDSRRGLDLLPRTYRITVEDKRRGVDLVPLHRALLSMEGVKDMSLLSYNNGVAIVALETVSDIEPDVLGQYVSRAMSRDARVEVHNEHTMVVKLAED